MKWHRLNEIHIQVWFIVLITTKNCSFYSLRLHQKALLCDIKSACDMVYVWYQNDIRRHFSRMWPSRFISVNDIILFRKFIFSFHGLFLSVWLSGGPTFTSFTFIVHNQDSYFEDKLKLPVCFSLTLSSLTLGTHTPGLAKRLWLEQMRRQNQTMTTDLESVFLCLATGLEGRFATTKPIPDQLLSRK